MSVWEENPPASEEEQYKQRRFKIDQNFHRKLKGMAQALLYLMYTYFDIYKKEGIRKFPKVVAKYTEEHQKEIDPYYNFIKEGIEIVYVNEDCKDRDLSKSVSVYKAFEKFKKWYSKFTSSNIPLNIDQNIFQKEMSKKNRLGKTDETNRWCGIKFVKRQEVLEQ